jgi:hypothetical protein
VALGAMMRTQLWVPLALKLVAWLYGQLADLVIEQAKIAAPRNRTVSPRPL